MVIRSSNQAKSFATAVTQFDRDLMQRVPFYAAQELNANVHLTTGARKPNRGGKLLLRSIACFDADQSCNRRPMRWTSNVYPVNLTIVFYNAGALSTKTRRSVICKN